MKWLSNRPVMPWVFSAIEMAGLVIFIVGATAIGGYIAGLPAMYSWTAEADSRLAVRAMALNTALCFSLIGPSLFYLAFSVGRAFVRLGENGQAERNAGAMAFAMDVFLMLMVVVCISVMVSGRAVQAITLLIPCVTFYMGRVSERGDKRP